MEKRRVLSGLMVMSFIATAGCGGGAPTAGTGTKPAEEAKKPAAETFQPVEVRIYQSVPVTDKDFKLLFEDPVKQKYPHITLKLLRPAQGARVPDLVAAGNVPDIILTHNGGFSEYKDLKLQTNIDPLVKKLNLDLSRFDTEVIDAIRMPADNGELYALPYAVNFNATYYNKGIFDKFGIPYPKDGMTWDQMLELAKSVTRLDNGMQYRGLEPDVLFRHMSPFSMPWVDASDKPALDSEHLTRVFRMLHDIYSIPGNRPAKVNDNTDNVTKGFLVDMNVAMFPTINLLGRMEEPMKNGLSWDVAQYPSYKEKPNTYGYVDAHVAFMTATSKVKEDALRVMEVLTSDEVQKISTRQTARVTPLKNIEIKKQLGADLPYMKGIKVESIFKSKPAAVPKASKYNSIGNKYATAAFQEYMDGKDLNSALREALEKANADIQREKQK
jgi:multiple sugar transport system substrate-binding protein